MIRIGKLIIIYVIYFVSISREHVYMYMYNATTRVHIKLAIHQSAENMPRPIINTLYIMSPDQNCTISV